MKILYLLNDGPDETCNRLIEIQAEEHDVEIVDLSKGNASYEDIVGKIFASDRVVSW